MFSLEMAPKKAGARKPRPGQRQLLLRHLDGNLNDLIRDTERLTVALEYHDSLAQGCTGSQRRVKLTRLSDAGSDSIATITSSRLPVSAMMPSRTATPSAERWCRASPMRRGTSWL